MATLLGTVALAVTADRGYGKAKIEQEPRGLGVPPGAQTWCGLGVLAHDTVKIAYLIQWRAQGPRLRRDRPGDAPYRPHQTHVTPSRRPAMSRRGENGSLR